MTGLSTDHDLLVVTVTKLDGIESSISKIEESLPHKASLDWCKRMDARIAALEKKTYMFCGALALAQAVIQFLPKLLAGR